MGLHNTDWVVLTLGSLGCVFLFSSSEAPILFMNSFRLAPLGHPSTGNQYLQSSLLQLSPAGPVPVFSLASIPS